MNLVVVGTGYVGLVTAVCMAEKGHNVICLDIDKDKIDYLASGKGSIIYEEGLDELMQKNKDRLEYSIDFANAYKNADVIFVCVGTPEKKDGSANLTYVFDAVKNIGEMAEKECVVVIKSTVPIGTNDKVEKILNEHNKNKVKFHVVSNPEFLAQGTAVHDTLHASRIVIGSEDKKATDIMLNVYKDFDALYLGNITHMTVNTYSEQKITASDLFRMLFQIEELYENAEINYSEKEQTLKLAFRSYQGNVEIIQNKFLNLKKPQFARI